MIGVGLEENEREGIEGTFIMLLKHVSIKENREIACLIEGGIFLK